MEEHLRAEHHYLHIQAKCFCLDIKQMSINGNIIHKPYDYGPLIKLSTEASILHKHSDNDLQTKIRIMCIIRAFSKHSQSLQ